MTRQANLKQLDNAQIANILSEMAVLYAMHHVEFKPRAYEKAAESVAAFHEDIGILYKREGIVGLQKIPGVGKGIAFHIEQLLTKGSFEEYRELKAKTPVQIEELMAVEGVGPQTINMLWERLKIKNLNDLEKAARAGKIEKLPGFGKKSQEKILRGIEFLQQTGSRKPLGIALHHARELEIAVVKFKEVRKVAIAGSLRRRKETIGDVDLLICADKPEKVTEQFLALPSVRHVFGKGTTKINVRLRNGLEVDVRVIPEESWGAALNYFTGSKAHNVALRKIAIKKGYKMNEYGLFKGKKMVAGKTEKEIYEKLEMSYMEPELREDTGEIDAAIREFHGEKPWLPKLIGYSDLKGDLQVQTDWTDGKNSIEEMALAAEQMGLEYIAITDHTKSLAMTNGTDEEKLLRQMKEIDTLNAKLRLQGKKVCILKGAEVNILKDGSLDIADEVLSQLDVVGAAVHTHFNLSLSEQTARVVAAMKNPHVDILFHPTGRLINKRKPIELDMEVVIAKAKETKTILEINASPERLDLKDNFIRRCVERGARMVIDSDAHAMEQYAFLPLGIAQARRGWAEKKDILNTFSLKEFLSQLK